MVFFDAALISTLEEIKDQIKTVKRFVVMGTLDTTIPPNKLPNCESYEVLVASGSESFEFPNNIDENDALGLCYTSGTTGQPKVKNV
jgi:fatty-acyl-CoA synthase